MTPNDRRPNILVFAGGSGGDVYPPLAIAKALKQRGHRVLFSTSPYFEQAARRAGLDFAGIGTAEEYLAGIQNPDLWKLGRGIKVLFDVAIRKMPGVYDLIKELYIPGQTAIVAPVVMLGARVANEKLGIPLVQFHVEIPGLRSTHQHIGPATPFAPLEPLSRRVLFAGLDRWVLDPVIAPRLNAFRSDLGLPPVKRVLDQWIHSPQMRLGLFPDWFLQPQPDWPPNTHLVGFPLADSGETQQVPEDLLQFLNSGQPPIVFTWGTAMRFAGELIQASAEACRLLGRRGVLLTEFAEQVPASLPDGVRHFRYAPFRALLPRAAAIVHHGGIGTLSQALAAGVPQLVTPFNFDQPVNARILRELGAGDLLSVRRYTPARAAQKLENILGSAAVAAKCRELKERIAGTDAIGEACRRIESVLTPRLEPVNHGGGSDE